ncbi:MAG: hypothetical protein JW863_15915 [Chitinispirillaceae bacterium]|nr:hypothetical protein [Chitinispirillaceae bacterium]
MNWPLLKNGVLLTAIELASTMLSCSFPGDSNGSGVGNGMITGKLFEPDGKTPANGAVVEVWDRNAHAGINSNDVVYTPTVLHLTQTDEHGVFSIDRIDPGIYAIEAFDDSENMARIDSVSIQTPDTRLDLLPDTLKTPGAIRGKIALENSSDIAKVIIVCFGKDLYCIADINGSFLLAPLAEGTYRLHILPTITDYIPIDIGEIRVTAADTVDLGTIVLQRYEIPSVGGLRIDYDSSLHSATISWKPTPPSVTVGYNLYRRVSGDSLFGPPVNGVELIKDTMFVDSMAFRGSTYEYCVALEDSTQQLGPMSNIITTATFRFTMNPDTIELVESGVHSIFNFVRSKNPKFLYLKNMYTDMSLCIESACPALFNIQKYSAEGNLLRSWKVPDYGQLIVDENDRLFYACIQDTIGDFIGYLDDVGNNHIVASYAFGSLRDYDVAGNSMVVVTGKQWDGSSDLNNSEIYKITEFLIADGTVIFSKEMKIESGWGVGGISINSEGTVRLLLKMTSNEKWIRRTEECTIVYPALRLLVLNASGVETSSFELLCDTRSIIYFSDSLYLVRSQQYSQNSSTTGFTAYNFSGIQLYNVELPELARFYLASNGDIYTMYFDWETEKTTACRFSNPLYNP